MQSSIFLLLWSAAVALAQTQVTHVSGEISHGQEYRHEIGPGLLFLLKPTDTGWMIGMVPKTRCVDFEDWASVVNAPYRGYNSLSLNTDYGVTAREAVKMNPRKFSFVVTCEAYKRESSRLEIVLWPYNHSEKEVDEATTKLGTSRLGRGSLTILKSRISQAEQIDWLQFRLDVAFPATLR